MGTVIKRQKNDVYFKYKKSKTRVNNYLSIGIVETRRCILRQRTEFNPVFFATKLKNNEGTI